MHYGVVQVQKAIRETALFGSREKIYRLTTPKADGGRALHILAVEAKKRGVAM